MDEKRIKSQKQMIEAHLLRNGSIEPLTALREYGCYRLGAIIFLLRSDGYNIETRQVDSISRITGRPVKFALYIMTDKKKHRPKLSEGI